MTRLLGMLIPSRYRREILADLTDTHQGLALYLAILQSARDARRQVRAPNSPIRTGSGLATDLIAAWRSQWARPGSTLTIVTILALAIGLNASVFSLVDGVVNRPLSMAEADRVQFVWTTSQRTALDTMAPARALDLRARVSAFEHAALIGHISMTVTGRGAAERWFGASVSSSFFDVLQSPPALGRTFSTREPDRDLVVLSHRLWIDQFGGDRSIVGTRVMMNGRLRTVVGVMPASFYWPSTTANATAENPPLFWTCAPAHDVPERQLVYDEDITRNRTMGFLRMVARLRADRTPEQAQEELDQVARDLAGEYPQTDGGRGARLVSARDQMLGSVVRPLWYVLLASGLVVLAAAVNVGSLILVRQAARRREFAVRAALGAGRARLVRMVVAETVLVTLIATVVGVGLAIAGLQLLVAAAPQSVGRLDAVTINTRVILWTAGVGGVVATLLGGLSAIVLWRDRSAGTLRGCGTAEPARTGVRRTLVAAEVALAVALLVSATLFGQSLWRLQRVDVGLNADRLLTFDIMLTGERAEYQAQQLAFYDGLFEGLRALPGVTAVSGAFTLPIGGDDFGAGAFPEGRPLPAAGEDRRVGFQIVWADWFKTLGMHVRQGRDFGPEDTRNSLPVVIINQALADLEFPNESPLGRRLRYAREEDAPWLTIIGVVSDVRHLGPDKPARPEIYLPYRQMTQAMMAVAVRTEGNPMDLVPAVRHVAEAVDPLQPTSGFSTMSGHLERAFGRARFLSRLTIVFALAAGVLTILGVYGVTSHTVVQRTREFGVRSALGASPGRVTRDVLRSSLAPVWVGVAAGLGVAAWSGPVVQALLVETQALDPFAYLSAVGVVVATTTAASLLPARRAAAIDPVRALRDD